MDADRARALALTPVPAETAARLDRFVELLIRWQTAKNLVGPATLPEVWTRHIADSLQLLALAPQARVWADLGSGAGFPGLVLAIALTGMPGAQVHLIESNQRKAAFLREAARATGAPATVHAGRAEDVLARLPPVDIVTARALASLADLLALVHPLLKTGATGLFPKGQDIETELTDSTRSWTLAYDIRPSVTDSRGRILRIDRAEPRAPHGASGRPP